MTQAQFQHLKEGDIIRGKLSGKSYIVTANYGNRVTAVRTVDVTNPSDWDVLRGPVESKKEEQQ